MAQIILDESTAPSAPAANKVTIYAKSDGIMYSKDDAGTETALSGAPIAADYLVKTANGALSAERVVTDGTSVTADWTTPGQVVLKRAALTGDVTASADSNATTIAAGAVTEAKQTLADVTTADVSITKHGYAPKAPNDATKFLDGTAAYDTVKDTDLVFSDVTTNNASTSNHGLAPKATAPASGLLSVLGIGNGETVRSDKAIFDTTNPAALGTAAPGTQVVAARRDHVHTLPAIDALAAATDITTANASTSAHGLLKKLSNVSTEFMNGVGNWATPASGVPGITTDGVSRVQQIAFAATQSASADANTLDDYEEGTWAPVIGGDGGTSGQTYSAQEGYYIKIGKKVTCWFNARLSAKGTITGSGQIQGLPFTALTVTNSHIVDASIGWVSLTTTWVRINMNVESATTAAYLEGVTGGSTGSRTGGNLTSAGDITALTGFSGFFSYIASA